MEPNDYQDPQSGRIQHGAIPGLIIIAIGVLFLLDNFHVVYVREWWRYWPVVLIAVGMVKLVDATYATGRIVGGVMMGVGALILGNNLGVIDVTIEQLWPLILIGIGLVMLGARIWGPEWLGPQRRFRHHHWKRNFDREKLRQNIENRARRGWEAGIKYVPDDDEEPPSPDKLNEVAIFGGGKRKVITQDFQGGELTAVFGGFEVDLREAGMTADSAILDVNTIFGGAEIKIPYSWTAVVQGVGIFGGYGDETTPPNPTTNPNSKKLFIRGAAVFGGVSVKN